MWWSGYVRHAPPIKHIMKKSVSGSKNNLPRYVLVSGGPGLGGSGVKVTLRELFSSTVTVATFSQYKKLEKAGRIERPAFMPKEKR
jgi:hypothetical protein